MQLKSRLEIINLLNRIFETSSKFMEILAPTSWTDSENIKFLHPTANQKYEERKRISERLNKLTRKNNETNIRIEKFKVYEQDDLSAIIEEEEFHYVLGLSTYDIFSDNHEVFSVEDLKVYDLGSFRGSGKLLANYFNNKYPNKNLDYLDFYMGTIWIRERANLMPFYEYIFNVLKAEKCDWNYFFPRLYIIDLINIEDSKDKADTYNPEEAMLNELYLKGKNQELDEFKNDLDFQFKYENVKYKPLDTIVKAYKKVYGKLPQGHPQNSL